MLLGLGFLVWMDLIAGGCVLGENCFLSPEVGFKEKQEEIFNAENVDKKIGRETKALGRRDTERDKQGLRFAAPASAGRGRLLEGLRDLLWLPPWQVSGRDSSLSHPLPPGASLGPLSPLAPTCSGSLSEGPPDPGSGSTPPTPSSLKALSALGAGE